MSSDVTQLLNNLEMNLYNFLCYYMQYLGPYIIAVNFVDFNVK